MRGVPVIPPRRLAAAALTVFAIALALVALVALSALGMLGLG